MTENYGQQVIAVSNIGRFELINVKLERSGGSITGQSFLDLVLKGYIDHSQTYMRGIGLIAYSPKCGNAIYSLNSYNVTVKNASLLYGFCDGGSAGLVLSGNSSIVIPKLDPCKQPIGLWKPGPIPSPRIITVILLCFAELPMYSQ
jgi:hypothetical protein